MNPVCYFVSEFKHQNKLGLLWIVLHGDKCAIKLWTLERLSSEERAWISKVMPTPAKSFQRWICLKYDFHTVWRKGVTYPFVGNEEYEMFDSRRRLPTVPEYTNHLEIWRLRMYFLFESCVYR